MSMICRWAFFIGLALLVAGCAGPRLAARAGSTPTTAAATPGVRAAAVGPGLLPGQTASPAPSSTAPPAGAATALPVTPGTVVAGTPTAASPVAVARPSPGGVPAFSHIFIIVMENKEATQVAGSASAPYLNSLATQYARAARYYAISHPSLPNYLALTGGQTFGVTTDCTTCFIPSTANIVTQLQAAGRSWKAYMESMPGPCYVGADTQLYARRHNPFIYYDNVRTVPAQCQNVVPLTQLEADIQANALPDFVWITPNVCSDTHDCTVATGDAWLRTWVPRILATPAWRNDGVLFLTFDEGLSASGCCGLAAGGRVDTLVISPLAKPGYVSQVDYSHYALLRTIEQAWNLPLLANAGSAATAAMTDVFK